MVRQGLIVPGPDLRRYLEPDTIREIRRLANTMLHREVAELFGVHRTLFSQIVRREIYQHVEG